MAVRIKTRKIDDIPVLAVTGNVESEDALKISRKLEALSRKPASHVAVDLSAIRSIDSHWFGVFVYTWKLYREKGKSLLFVIPPGFVRRLFHDANLDKAFTIVSSVEELGRAARSGDTATVQG